MNDITNLSFTPLGSYTVGKVKRELTSFNFHLTQDLNNKLLLNAVKGKRKFTCLLFSQQFTSVFITLFVETIHCCFFLPLNVLQPFHPWKLDWVALCKIRSFMELKIIGNLVLLLFGILKQSLVSLKGVYQCIGGMSLTAFSKKQGKNKFSLLSCYMSFRLCFCMN